MLHVNICLNKQNQLVLVAQFAILATQKTEAKNIVAKFKAGLSNIVRPYLKLKCWGL